MNGSASFGAQVRALREQETSAKRTLTVLDGLDTTLASRLRTSFLEDATRVEERLDHLEQDYAARGAPCADTWRELIAVRDEAEELFAEWLAVTTGAWARREQLDGGLCQLADVFVNELSERTQLSWNRLTIPAEREFYADQAQVIRLRFPHLGIWDLPLTAHEFGHFAAERLDVAGRSGYVRARRNLVRDALDQKARSGEQGWAFAHEYFADAFATYTAGPAYLCCCVFLRFDPLDAHSDGWEHPAAAKRVALMLDVLTRMDDRRVGLVRFRPLAQRLSAAWAQILKAADAPADLPADARADVTARAQEIFSLLHESRPTAAYDSFHRAQALSTQLAEVGALPSLRTGDRLADVLNAAWLSRLDHWQAGEGPTERLAQRARLLYEQIVSEPSA